jgi:hypothetical protein
MIPLRGSDSDVRSGDMASPLTYVYSEVSGHPSRFMFVLSLIWFRVAIHPITAAMAQPVDRTQCYRCRSGIFRPGPTYWSPRIWW